MYFYKGIFEVEVFNQGVDTSLQDIFTKKKFANYSWIKVTANI